MACNLCLLRKRERAQTKFDLLEGDEQNDPAGHGRQAELLVWPVAVE